MTTYSLANAQEHLSRLIDEALAGHEVTISRHGRTVVAMRPVPDGARSAPPADLLDEISRFAGTLAPSRDATALIRGMRDEE